jgi:hypothetical protein
MFATEIDGLGGHFTEVLDDDTSALSLGAWIDAHPHAHRKVRVGLAACTPEMFEQCVPPGNVDLCQYITVGRQSTGNRVLQYQMTGVYSAPLWSRIYGRRFG